MGRSWSYFPLNVLQPANEGNSAEPTEISGRSASVTFNDKIILGKSYNVVFWAQKEGAPYSIDWAKNATTVQIYVKVGNGNNS